MNKLIEITQKQILRGYALKICQKAGKYGAGCELIAAALKREGYSASKEDIAEACWYLEGKGLVQIENVNNSVLKINRDIARITSKGTDALEGTEIIEGIELADG